MKILIFGKGFLGQRLAASVEGSLISDVNILDRAALSQIIAQEKPDAVINAAGKTGKPNVDWC